METVRRDPKRKALADRTNFDASSLSRASKKKPSDCSDLSRRIARNSKKLDENSTNSIQDDASTGSNVAPSPTTSTPPPQPKTLADSDTIDGESSEALTVYHRRRSDRSKDKGKQVMDGMPFSCPPPERIRKIWDALITEKGDTTKLKKGRRDAVHFNTNPHSKNKKKYLFSTPEQHSLPQDFIDKQSAYFAEVDAFELPEEEASESELD